MIEPKPTSPLLFVPTGDYVEAKVVRLTTEMADEHIHGRWWRDEGLKEYFSSPPIDRHWDWNEMVIEYQGRILMSEKVAIVVGDEASVEGAMMLSSEPVNSVLDSGKLALFVEPLLTAPRNRPLLRADDGEFLKGIGTELLTWGAWFSRENGYEGRLRLEGSPEFLGWYSKRGLQTLHLNPILYESVEYTPMELSPSAAGKLLASWEDA